MKTECVALQAMPRYQVLCSSCLQTMCDLTPHCLLWRKLHILHSLFGRDHYSHYHTHWIGGHTIVTVGGSLIKGQVERICKIALKAMTYYMRK